MAKLFLVQFSSVHFFSISKLSRSWQTYRKRVEHAGELHKLIISLLCLSYMPWTAALQNILVQKDGWYKQCLTSISQGKLIVENETCANLSMMIMKTEKRLTSSNVFSIEQEETWDSETAEITHYSLISALDVLRNFELQLLWESMKTAWKSKLKKFNLQFFKHFPFSQ